MRIIFIDQHPDEIEDLEQKLKGLAEIELCESAEEAQEKLESDEFDVVFIDYDINTRSMEQLNQTIQQNHPSIKRVISSRVLSTKFFKEHGKGKYQAFAYLKRPYNLELIQETLGLEQHASDSEMDSSTHTKTKATSVDIQSAKSDSSQSINFSEASQLFDHIFDEKAKDATKSKKITVKKPVKATKGQSTEIDLSENGLTPESSGFLNFSTSDEDESSSVGVDSDATEPEDLNAEIDSSSSGINLSGLDQSMTDLQLEDSKSVEEEEEQNDQDGGDPPPLEKSFTGTTIGTDLRTDVEEDLDLGSIELAFDDEDEIEGDEKVDKKAEETLTATQMKSIPKPPEISFDDDQSLTIQAQANSGANPKEFKLDQDGIRPKTSDLGTVEFSNSDEEDIDKTRIQCFNLSEEPVTKAFENKTDSQSATMDLFAQSDDAETEIVSAAQDQATVLVNQRDQKNVGDYQEFLAFQKEELERMSANLKITRSDRENLLKKIDDLQEVNGELKKENINLKAETDELKI